MEKNRNFSHENHMQFFAVPGNNFPILKKIDVQVTLFKNAGSGCPVIFDNVVSDPFFFFLLVKYPVILD